jgi:hypothetical protein
MRVGKLNLRKQLAEELTEKWRLGAQNQVSHLGRY